MADWVGASGLRRATKTITFDGSAGLGALGTFNVLTVTGEVLVVYIAAFCVTSLTVDGGTGTAQVRLGCTNNTSLFVGLTNAVDIDAGEIWVTTTPDAVGIALPAACREIVITDSITGEVVNGGGNQIVNGGSLRVDVYYLPLSSDGAIA